MHSYQTQSGGRRRRRRRHSVQADWDFPKLDHYDASLRGIQLAPHLVHITNVENSPLEMDSTELEPIVITDFPGLSDAEIDVPALYSYLRMINPVARAFRERKSDQSFEETTIADFSALRQAEDELRRREFEREAHHGQLSTDDIAEIHQQIEAKRLFSRRARERIQKAERDAERELKECIRIVPHQYFEHDFSSKRALYIGKLFDRPDSTLIQEKLSHFVDTVEINIGKQIVARSHSLFAALLSIKSLHREVSRANSTVTRIRSRIRELERGLVTESMRALANKRRQHNVIRLVRTMSQVQQVVEAQTHIKTLISDANYTAAIELVLSTRHLLRTSLRNVRALQFVDSKLDQMFILMEKMLCTEFVNISVDAQRPDYADMPIREVFMYGGEISQEQRQLLASHLRDLSTIGKEALLLSRYREHLRLFADQRMIEVVQWQVSQSIPNASVASFQPTSVSGTRAQQKDTRLYIQHAAKQFSYKQFSRMLRYLFRSMLVIMQRMHAVHEVVIKVVHETVLDGISRSKGPRHTQRKGKSATSLSSADKGVTMGLARNAREARVLADQFLRHWQELITSVCESIHGTIASVISVRSNVFADRSLVELQRFFDVAKAFNDQSAQLCGKRLTGLQSTLLNQARLFVDRFHQSNMARLEEKLSSETWQCATIPRSYQILIDLGLDRKRKSTRSSRTRSIEERSASSRKLVDSANGNSTAATATTVGSTSSSPSTITIEESIPLEDDDEESAEQPDNKTNYSVALTPFAAAAAAVTGEITTEVSAASTGATDATGVVPGAGAGAGASAGAGADADTKMHGNSLLLPPSEVDDEDHTFDDGSVDEIKTTTSHVSTSDTDSKNASTGDNNGDSNTSSSSSSSSSATATATAAATAAVKTARVLFVVAVDPTTGKKKTKFEKYPVALVVLEVLDMAAAYIECASQLLHASSELMTRLCQLLSHFNTRSCGLVLGAGAMHTAGLRSINAKHLTLSSQCLGLIYSQLPVIRKAFASKLQPSQHPLLSVFDSLSSDIHNHQQEIYNKLLDIVTNLVESTCKALIATSWASNPQGVKAVPPGTKLRAEDCIRSLMRQTSSLHRVLSDLLPNERRDAIFAKVVKVFSELLCKYLSTINVCNDGVRFRISVNVVHVIKRLRMLDGLGADACRELDVFVFKP
jgi:Vps54-like protein/Vacuolar-sorting protein 54, of GARP complex